MNESQKDKGEEKLLIEKEVKKINLYNKLKSIHIQNFKSISNIELECKSINLFIGENGTGKSSVYEIIGFFFQSINEMKITGPLTDWGLFQRIFNKHNLNRNINLRVEYQNEFSIVSRNQKYMRPIADTYQCDILISSITTPEDKQIYEFKTYSSLIQQTKKIVSWQNYVSFNENGIKTTSSNDFGDYESDLNASFKEVGFEYAEYITHGRLTGSGSSSLPNGIWNLIRTREFVQEDLVEDWLEFKLDSYLPKLNIIPANRHVTQWVYALDDNPPETISLDDSGQSLATFLMYYKDRKYLDFWKKLEFWIKKFGYSNFEIIPKPGSLIAMDVIDLEMDASVNLKAVGSGMNSLTGLIIKCILSKKDDILLIEEPEVHLHPKFQAVLIDLIIETAKKGVQIFITTHSEYVLLHFQTKIANKTLTADDVVVYEFKRTKEGSVADIIEIDKQGLFKNGLPSFLEHSRKEFRILEEGFRRN